MESENPSPQGATNVQEDRAQAKLKRKEGTKTRAQSRDGGWVEKHSCVYFLLAAASGCLLAEVKE